MSADAELARRLIDGGLLAAAALVDGRVTFRDASSRNRNTLVDPEPGRVLFVKRPSGRDDGALAGEAAWYRRLGALHQVAHLMPSLERQADDGMLVLGGERDAVDLWSHHLAQERFPDEIGRALGAVLATLHRCTRLAPDRAEPGLPAASVPAIHRPRVDALRELTPASIELIATVQAHPSLGPALDAARRGWVADCVIHADLKWRNVLVAVPPGTTGPSIRLVDWEHAGRGDAAWDLGSAFAAYLTFWLHSIVVEPGAADPARLASAARFPLDPMRPAIAACWRGYQSAAGLPSGEAAALLERAVACAAARLVLSAYESTQSAPRMGADAALHLQVAANMLDDPARAAERLLGLDPGADPRVA